MSAKYTVTGPSTEEYPKVICGWEHADYAHRNTDRYAYIGKSEDTREPEFIDYGPKHIREANRQN